MGGTSSATKVRIMTRIIKILALHGRNIWSRSPVLEIRLANDASKEASPSSTDEIRGMLKDWLFATPNPSAEVSGQKARIWQRIKDATNPFQPFAHGAPELQGLGGNSP